MLILVFGIEGSFDDDNNLNHYLFIKKMVCPCDFVPLF